MFSLNDIKYWCGNVAYQRGKKYYQAHFVQGLQRLDDGSYAATVVGTKRYRVKAKLAGADSDELEAQCNCPAFGVYDDYCKHVVALLFAVHDDLLAIGDRNQATPDVGSRAIGLQHAAQKPDVGMAQRMLSLFAMDTISEMSAHGASQKEADAQAQSEFVQIEYTCVIEQPFSNRVNMLAIEMKMGPKRLYVVQKMKELLEHVQDRRPYTFTKLFTLDYRQYRLTDLDERILQKLIAIKDAEDHYRKAFNYTYSNTYLHGSNGDRYLMVPPTYWQDLWPLLRESGIMLKIGYAEWNNPTFTEEPVGLISHLHEAPSAGYQLHIDGLKELVHVYPEYGFAAKANHIHLASRESLQRLVELRLMFAKLSDPHLFVAKEQIEPFMERVAPELKRLGTLDVAPQVARQVVDAPLLTKLYLDRDGDRLLARAQYVYGDLTIDSHAQGSRQDYAQRIVMRDVAGEARFMALLKQCAWLYDGTQLYTDHEDQIYHFLYHIVPQIQLLSEVFISSSVQAMIERDEYRPAVTADLHEVTNWLEINFSIDGIDDAEIRDILRSLVEKKKYYRLSDGGFLSFEEQGFVDMAQILADLDVRKVQIKGGRLQVPVMRGLHLLTSEDRVSDLKLGRRLRHLLDNLKNPDNLEFPVPETLSHVLRDYQEFGYQWMKTLAYYQFGGILADDMGLGKTLQSIAFILSELQLSRASSLPTLIVCPASLTFNWRNELQRFAPDVKVAIAVGGKDERALLLENLSEVDVVVTSYPILRRDAEIYGAQPFFTLILDEAQAFKNHQTQTAQAVKQIKARHRFALTGTPVENSLSELWSIYDVVFPDLFGGKTAFDAMSSEQVAKRIRPFLLRRLKKDVLKELPDKIETLQTTELTIEQKKLYLAYHARLQKDTLAQLQTHGLQKSRMQILAGILRLRQLCCHPALFVEDYKGGSGKLDQFLEIVDECMNGGKRMLVFSQFTEMLTILREELMARRLDTFYLDGKTPPSERVTLCDRFNVGEADIFLISLKAGGTGLNLTGADTVLLYDLWWNPAVEEQAADRAHRMGQKNVVQVIRLVTEGTIEEKMYQLQQRKKDLISQVVQPGEPSFSALTEQEIRELLMIDS